MVTGASGFVGWHVARHLLSHGWKTHAVVRPRSDLEQLHALGDGVTVHVHDGSTEKMLEICRAARADVTFHLAATGSAQHQPSDLVPLLQSNIVFGTQLLEGMVAAGRTRIVSTGTYWQHYENKDYSPVCLYAACKEAFEKILQYYVEAFGIQAITLVLFDTYGASDRRGKLFSLLYEAAVSRTPLDMTPGEQLVDLVHVDDVANAYRVAAERLMTAHGTVNDTFAIGSGSPLRLRDLVAIYSDVTGLDVPIRWGGRAYRQREVMSPWSRGHRLPGWTSKIDMGRGLRDLYHTISKRQV